MSDDMKTKVGIILKDQMIFKCDLGSMKVKDCYIDEAHKDEVDMLGPNPSRMLAFAILGCLSASFIFCLQKKNFSLDDLKAEAEVSFAQLPEAVQAYLTTHFPGVTFDEMEMEMDAHGLTTYSVETNQMEYTFSADGTLLSKESDDDGDDE